jgi:hypothetical protein
MAKTYFKPDDLSPAEARKVLEFLNRAASARDFTDFSSRYKDFGCS